MGGGWVSAFFVMLRDGKHGKQGGCVVLDERPLRHGKKHFFDHFVVIYNLVSKVDSKVDKALISDSNVFIQNSNVWM